MYRDSTLKQIITVFLHISFDDTVHFHSWKSILSYRFVAIIRLRYKAIDSITLS